MKQFTSHKVEFDLLPDDAVIRQNTLIINKIYPKSPASLWRDIRAGKFPKPIKIGEKCTAWRVSEVRKYLKNLGV